MPRTKIYKSFTGIFWNKNHLVKCSQKKYHPKRQMAQMPTQPSQGYSYLIFHGLFGNVEAVSNFPVGKVFKTAQSENFLATGWQLAREVLNYALQFNDLQLVMIFDLMFEGAFFPACKSHSSQFAFPDFIRHFVFYCGKQVGFCIGNGPDFTIFPNPNKYLLNDIHAHFTIPGHHVSRTVHILPIAMKQSRECLSVSRCDVPQQFVISNGSELIFHIPEINRLAKISKIFLTFMESERYKRKFE